MKSLLSCRQHKTTEKDKVSKVQFSSIHIHSTYKTLNLCASPPLPSHSSISPLYPASHSFPHSSAHRLPCYCNSTHHLFASPCFIPSTPSIFKPPPTISSSLFLLCHCLHTYYSSCCLFSRQQCIPLSSLHTKNSTSYLYLSTPDDKYLTLRYNTYLFAPAW